MKQEVGINGFKIYENNSEFYGMAEITLPEITLRGEEITGAGIAGAFTSAFVGQTEAMSLTLNFRAVTQSLVSLCEPRIHQITALASQQTRDNNTGSLTQKQLKYVIAGQPTKFNPGKLAPAASTESVVEFSATCIGVYLDGRELVYVDQINYIYRVNGTDYLADVRRNIGMN
jgi:P2 family phage contractile tail tube protein